MYFSLRRDTGLLKPQVCVCFLLPKYHHSNNSLNLWFSNFSLPKTPGGLAKTQIAVLSIKNSQYTVLAHIRLQFFLYAKNLQCSTYFPCWGWSWHFPDFGLGFYLPTAVSIRRKIGGNFPAFTCTVWRSKNVTYVFPPCLHSIDKRYCITVVIL